VLRAAELIERKRDGDELDSDEIATLVLAYARGEVPDEQMAAFCMAVYFRGLSSVETYALTDAMIRSGETVDLSPVGVPCVDKHSTGGVGDKTSIALGPIVSACGVPFAKMSGRGLGHTGGTLDKLESIPGFRVELDRDEFVRQVGSTGLAIIGQTDDLVPADKRLYALRDVTATVEEVSLIAASIMSKKLAAGAEAMLLDVKVGEGAFMKTHERARALAESMLELGLRAGRRVVCEITAMDEPLGSAVGNAIEVREALATLRGDGPGDFTELVLRSATQWLVRSASDVDEAEGRRRAEHAITSGAAVEAYERWVAAQGGDPDERALPQAPVMRTVVSDRDGFVTRLSALGVGRAAAHLGAGRLRKEASVDHATGVLCFAKRGASVTVGQPLAEVHARDEPAAEAAIAEVAACYSIGSESPEPTPLVLEVLS